MRLALYQPDIPQNTGTIIRLCACLGVALDIIEPCGFTFTDRDLKRSALDYAPLATIVRHPSWEAFTAAQPAAGRLVLITTQGQRSLYDHCFSDDETLLLGSEQAGVPADVHAAADMRLRIPMTAGARSLNLALSAAIAISEMKRQLGIAGELA